MPWLTIQCKVEELVTVLPGISLSLIPVYKPAHSDDTKGCGLALDGELVI